VSLLLHHEIFVNKKPLDSHIPAPLAPEVISQAVDLPLPPPLGVLEGNIDVESTPSIGMKSVESKLPKWLKLAQSECDAKIHYVADTFIPEK
jgi:hypothetical protein